MPETHVLFVLQCDQRMFYVGREPASTYKSVLDAHRAGTRCEFTRLYPPMKVQVAKASPAKCELEATTIRLMADHGYGYVRSDTYQDVKLPASTARLLRYNIGVMKGYVSCAKSPKRAHVGPKITTYFKPKGAAE